MLMCLRRARGGTHIVYCLPWPAHAAPQLCVWRWLCHIQPVRSTATSVLTAGSAQGTWRPVPCRGAAAAAAAACAVSLLLAVPAWLNVRWRLPGPENLRHCRTRQVPVPRPRALPQAAAAAAPGAAASNLLAAAAAAVAAIAADVAGAAAATAAIRAVTGARAAGAARSAHVVRRVSATAAAAAAAAAAARLFTFCTMALWGALATGAVAKPVDTCSRLAHAAAAAVASLTPATAVGTAACGAGHEASFSRQPALLVAATLVEHPLRLLESTVQGPCDAAHTGSRHQVAVWGRHGGMPLRQLDVRSAVGGHVSRRLTGGADVQAEDLVLGTLHLPELV